MRLGPIDDSAVAEIAKDLVGAVPGPSLARELTRAAGNPFYVTELLQQLAEARAVEVHEGYAHLRGMAGPLQLPLVASHLRSPSEAARHLVEMGSVLGNKFAERWRLTCWGSGPAHWSTRL